MTIKLEVHKSKTRWPRKRPQKYYWTATARNGRQLCRSSEMYTNKADCENAMITCMTEVAEYNGINYAQWTGPDE